MNIFQNTYSTREVLEASGLTNARLQSWLRGERIVGHRGKESDIANVSRSGSNRRFSFFNVMEIAVAKELSDLGMSTANAFNAASHFAHSGGENRLPSLTFRGDGLTIIAANGDTSTEVLFRPGEDVLSNLHYRFGKGFIILFVDQVFERVCQALGHDYRDVLTDAYKTS